MLELLGVSKSGYYSWPGRGPSKRSLEKARVKEAIGAVYEAGNCIYGAPKITAGLRKQGFRTSERTVTRYMKEMGIRACRVRPYTVTTHSEDFSDDLKSYSSKAHHGTMPA